MFPKKFQTLALFLPGICIAYAAMPVDLYVHKDKFGKSLTLEIGGAECTNVPRLWANLTQSLDTHGSCMQFYDRKNCKGRIAVIQPFHTVHQMDLSLIQFHNAIESVSPCGAKVPTGRYVIQSAVDASMLTVQRQGNTEFAQVNTLPPQAFIPKAQQWEVVEKQPNEYDIMPRIHETNSPVTYDSEAMKKGNFIRKVWKIESVGRGRYVIKSEWSQKCLYKTRVRSVEEHDCRAFSPNQEWVLRPLIAPTKPPPTKDPQLADGVNFQVPSRVVDKYLDEQKRLREKDAKRRNKEKEGQRIGAYLEPYRIKHKKNKGKEVEDNEEEQDNSEEEQDEEQEHGKYRVGSVAASQQNTFVQPAPPGPEVMYSRPAPIFNYVPQSHGGQPAKVISYLDGIVPIYEDAKVEDPVFPDFLLHAATDSAEDDRASSDEYAPPKYTVTRRPSLIPEPTGHPDYVPGKKKYDSRIKQQQQQQKDDEDETNSDESGEDEEDEEQEQSEEQTQTQTPTKPDANKVSITYNSLKDPKVVIDPNLRHPAPPSTTTPAPKTTTPKEEESEEEEEDNEDTSQEDESQKVKGQKRQVLDEDDPGADISSFMKLLFRGISNRIEKKDKTSGIVEDLR